MRFENLTAASAHGASLDGLLQAVGAVANGTVLYDGAVDGSDKPTGEPDATRYVALTLCGLESLLPVTPALRATHPFLAALPVVHDLHWAPTEKTRSWF